VTQDSIAVVERVYADWSQGRFWTEDLYTDDLELRWFPDMPDRDETKGTSDVIDSVKDWLASWRDVRVVPERYIPAGERVVVVASVAATGRQSGVELVHHLVHVWTVRGDRIARVEAYSTLEEALAAAGVGESGAT
jgi:ketosteroid isomerase-like protein